MRTLVWQSVLLYSSQKHIQAGDGHIFVYILSNDTNVCLYVGMTNDLERRLYEHKNELDKESFTARYHIHKLVYYEETPDSYAAVTREKQIKGWNRKRKNKLIEKNNPEWKDLADGWSE